MSVCRDLGTFVKRNKNQLHDYMTTGPARLAEIPTKADIFSMKSTIGGKIIHSMTLLISV